RSRARRSPLLRPRRRDGPAAAARARRRGRAQRRHSRGDRAAARPLPRAAGARGRALPRHRTARAAPRRALDRRGVRGDPAGAGGARARVIIRKTPDEIERIARAGALVAETIAYVGERLQPGVTTGE